MGTILEISSDDVTYAAIGQVKDISGPSMSKDTVDVTTHDSANRYREKLSSLKDGGQVSFELEWDPEDAAQQADLLTAFEGTAAYYFKLITTSANTHGYAFQAHVIEFSPSTPVEGSNRASVTLEVTGKPTLGAQTAS